MAIVIEEEKSRANIVNLIGWLAVTAVVASAVYYMFFAAPNLVIISPSGDFQTIAPIAQISLHPEDVLNSPAFQALKVPAFALPTPQGPAAVGRQNPLTSP
jgi:hypothetical protein